MATSESNAPKGIHDAKPLPEGKIVDNYEERPYDKAVTKEHKRFLAESDDEDR